MIAVTSSQRRASFSHPDLGALQQRLTVARRTTGQVALQLRAILVVHDVLELGVATSHWRSSGLLLCWAGNHRVPAPIPRPTNAGIRRCQAATLAEVDRA